MLIFGVTDKTKYQIPGLRTRHKHPSSLNIRTPGAVTSARQERYYQHLDRRACQMRSPHHTYKAPRPRPLYTSARTQNQEGQQILPGRLPGKVVAFHANPSDLRLQLAARGRCALCTLPTDS